MSDFTYDEDGRPIPPNWMIEIVVGNKNAEAFVKSGDWIAGGFAALVSQAGQDIGAFAQILDFGCGCGRILRSMPKHTMAKLVGCDLKEDVIEWCRRHMPFADFFVGKEYPPIPLADDRFDLIYAVSVLTHLDEKHQNLWLEEWARLGKKGSLLIVTFRGEVAIETEKNEQLELEIRKGWKENDGFYFRSAGQWEGIYPSFYQGAYHTYDYVRKNWGNLFDIIKIFPAGTSVTNQDIALMRNRPASNS